MRRVHQAVLNNWKQFSNVTRMIARNVSMKERKQKCWDNKTLQIEGRIITASEKSQLTDHSNVSGWLLQPRSVDRTFCWRNAKESANLLANKFSYKGHYNTPQLIESRMPYIHCYKLGKDLLSGVIQQFQHQYWGIKESRPLIYTAPPGMGKSRMITEWINLMKHYAKSANFIEETAFCKRFMNLLQDEKHQQLVVVPINVSIGVNVFPKINIESIVGCQLIHSVLTCDGRRNEGEASLTSFVKFLNGEFPTLEEAVLVVRELLQTTSPSEDIYLLIGLDDIDRVARKPEEQLLRMIEKVKSLQQSPPKGMFIQTLITTTEYTLVDDCQIINSTHPSHENILQMMKHMGDYSHDWCQRMILETGRNYKALEILSMTLEKECRRMGVTSNRELLNEVKHESLEEEFHRLFANEFSHRFNINPVTLQRYMKVCYGVETLDESNEDLKSLLRQGIVQKHNEGLAIPYAYQRLFREKIGDRRLVNLIERVMDTRLSQEHKYFELLFAELLQLRTYLHEGENIPLLHFFRGGYHSSDAEEMTIEVTKKKIKVATHRYEDGNEDIMCNETLEPININKFIIQNGTCAQYFGDVFTDDIINGKRRRLLFQMKHRSPTANTRKRKLSIENIRTEINETKLKGSSDSILLLFSIFEVEITARTLLNNTNRSWIVFDINNISQYLGPTITHRLFPHLTTSILYINDFSWEQLMRTINITTICEKIMKERNINRFTDKEDMEKRLSTGRNQRVIDKIINNHIIIF